MRKFTKKNAGNELWRQIWVMCFKENSTSELGHYKHKNWHFVMQGKLKNEKYKNGKSYLKMCIDANYHGLGHITR